MLALARPYGERGLMTQYDIAILWLASLFAGACAVAARISYMLFAVSESPPDDLIALGHWQRKRRWLVISDISALPAFATIAVVATIYWKLPAVASVGISMILGILGFGFLLNGLQFFVRRKLEMEEPKQ